MEQFMQFCELLYSNKAYLLAITYEHITASDVKLCTETEYKPS